MTFALEPNTESRDYNSVQFGVSIVIPTYNNGKTIRTVLDSLMSLNRPLFPLQIIVIDDCSRDCTLEIARGYPVQIIENESNKGLAATLNRGIQASRYDIVVTLHGDTVPVTPNWLEELVSPLIDPKVCASCSLQDPPTKSNLSLTFWEQLLWARLDSHHALNDKADAYRKSELYALGMFDSSRFRTAGEDEDLALRLVGMRKRIVASDGRVIHFHKFDYASPKLVLMAIFRKEFSFGRAGGALRRKFPSHRPGGYVHVPPKSFVADGLFRVICCISSLAPGVQVISLPVLFLFAGTEVSMVVRKSRRRAAYVLYPFFNLARYWIYSSGYVVGLATGKQL